MDSRKVNILLVDDRPENMLALEVLLEHPEYNLVKARSGPEALRRLLGEEEFAVIILDVRMAEMDGFETAALLRGRDKTRDTPIIFLTAYERDHDQVLQGYSLGAVDYLFKPPEPPILRAKVAVFVELFKKGRDLREQAAQLKVLTEELESFCYSVSHDLRAPLIHVHGFVQAFRQDCASTLDSTGQNYLARISESAKKMGRLIDDLLLFSRMARTELEHDHVHMSELVEETLAELARDTAGRNIEWKIESLPEVAGDRAMLKQIWVNLLSNAAKFTRQSDPAVVRVRCEKTRDAELQFSVHDNGVGFDMKQADKLFGVFQRLHQDEFEGSGVGLANVRRIVHRHGGRTWAEGKVSEGATFYFTLPAGTAQNMATRPSPRDLPNRLPTR
jgi:two-component system, sensor histidine kinase and response regulator